MPIDLRELLPRNTHDHQAASAVIALGYPAVAPILPDLLEWLQDYNWPVSRPIAEFLQADHGRELKALRRYVQRGRPYGRKEWQKEIAKRLALESAYRPAGRPRIAGTDRGDTRD
jgi:hypothetical protein